MANFSKQAAMTEVLPIPVQGPVGEGRPDFTFAAALLADMQRYAVAPIPANYELWFTYLEGNDRRLTRSMTRLLANKEVVSPADLAALREEFRTGNEVDRQLLDAGADELHDVAQVLIEQVGNGRAATKDFSDALFQATQSLGQAPTIDSLVDAIATLSSETARASERNRVLEQQLSLSASRITRLRQSLAEVRQEAATDALTGIANRRAFDIKLKRAIGQARSDAGSVFSLLLLDVDYFKSFNDSHGHKAGDLALRLIARLLTDNVKGRDTVARYGGEEFAILMMGAESAAAAVVARQISKALSGKRLVNRTSGQDMGQVTVSIGVAQVRIGDNAPALLERADAALYEAKRNGRNQVRLESELISLIN